MADPLDRGGDVELIDPSWRDRSQSAARPEKVPADRGCAVAVPGVVDGQEDPGAEVPRDERAVDPDRECILGDPPASERLNRGG